LAESQSHNSFVKETKSEICMNKHNILFIGLDTHKEFVEVAYIEDQRGAQALCPLALVWAKHHDLGQA
ncbi:hypothetical protein, partial [Shewanella sp. GutDb-MelDb]|uniref:hypothetical protein n=1 Tax=Shewanella sp. GutDb-MelDb TaxID=2058316 RepID=UPI001C60CB08